MRKFVVLLSALLVLTFVLSGLALAAGSVSGALHIADSSGNYTDTFAYKEYVYLAGNKLPPGDYYVRVTNTNGSVVLGVPPVDGASDPVRKVTVDPNGQLHELYKLWDLVVIDGEEGFADSSDGTYKVWLSMNPSFPHNESKTGTFRIIGEECPTVGHLGIVKFYDYNLNGVFDEGEQVLPDWLVHVFDGVDWWEYTGDTTNPLVLVLPFDEYTVVEATPDQCSWVPTTPTSVGTVLSLEHQCDTVWFGNVCLGCGGGHTLGFWSNKNGKKTMDATADGVPGLIQKLRVLGGQSAPVLWKFPTTDDHASFNAWILNAKASEMRYMLSAQLAAMELNVWTGFVVGDDYVYCPEVTAGEGAMGLTVNALMQRAVDALAAGSSTREYLEVLKTALDKANNNLTFVQKQPCPYTFVNTLQ